MERVRDYDALIRELLAGVAGGWTYGGVTGWLIGKGINERDLAQWLREHGAALGADAEVRAQLGCLAGLGRGELAEVAGELVKGWEPEVEEWQEWFKRGNELFELGKYEEAIASYDREIEIKPDKHQAWFNRGSALDKLARYDEAISSYDLAIAIKPDNDKYWACLGVALSKLGRYEKAIYCYERAIEINPERYAVWMIRGVELDKLARYEEAISSYDRVIEIESDYDMVWYCRGVALVELARYEAAIFSFEQAIGIKPDKHETWYNRGVALSKLGQCEEAIASYDRAVKIDPNCYYCWDNRGTELAVLGRYEEAIASYERAIEFKHDLHGAWENRGITLGDLGRYEEAIASFERAIEFKYDLHKAWNGRGIAIGILYGYQAEINAYHQAFQHISSETHPEGWGLLQYEIGHTHYKEGKYQLFRYRKNPQPYYYQALTNYHNALQTLPREQFPELRIKTLIHTAKVYLAQHNTPAAHQCKTQAFEILQDLLNAQPTFAGKKHLQIEYHSLRQLDVDLFITSGDNINALVAAELDKNNRLTWLLSALAETTISPSYAEMQQLLATTEASAQTGIVYWHLSPDSLTTFILTANDSQPLVWESDRRSQAQQLAKWIKKWDTQYRDYGSKKDPSQQDEAAAKAKEQHPWRQNLPDALARLRQILEIDRICAQLPATLTHLILIPHGDLHRFPLHTLFLSSAKLPNLQGCTYLPSIQIGLNLQQRSISNRSYTPLLSVEDPETHQDAMPFAQIESTIVRHLLQPHTHINSASADLVTVENALKQPHASFHFTGHAAYNSRSPEASALALTDEPLTAKRISQLDLSSYNLITLAACETAITGREKIDTEYVGLTSAFLQAGAANVLSTLWQVDEIANAWFTIYFYQQLLAGKSPAVALALTQRWMQSVTLQNLADWLTQLSQLTHLEIGIIDRLKARITNTLREGGTIGLNIPTKYSHPYYWAAFTLTGEG
jgi:tetratricopeptide (TPR) repeat protein